jgi:hypothetical protein
MKFRTTILQSGKTATGIEVPEEVVTALGSGRKPAVLATIGGHTYRSTIATMGGRFMLPVSAENRTAAGVAGGDEIDVDLELDTEPRTIDVPADFAAALDAEPRARATFDGLSNSNKGWHVSSITGAKTDETRERRIARSVETLSQGRAR